MEYRQRHELVGTGLWHSVTFSGIQSLSPFQPHLLYLWPLSMCQRLHINAHFVPCLCIRETNRLLRNNPTICAVIVLALPQIVLYSRTSEPPSDLWATTDILFCRRALSHLSPPTQQPQLMVYSKGAFTSVCNHSDQLVPSVLGLQQLELQARVYCFSSPFHENTYMFSTYCSHGVQQTKSSSPCHLKNAFRALLFTKENQLASVTSVTIINPLDLYK